jgi:hypothetical protein
MPRCVALDLKNRPGPAPGDQFAEISRYPTHRRIVIPAAPNLAYRELRGFPSTIRIGPGKLELTRIDAQDLHR